MTPVREEFEKWYATKYLGVNIGSAFDRHGDGYAHLDTHYCWLRYEAAYSAELRRYISQLEFVLKWWLDEEKISDIDIMHTIDLKILSELARDALKKSPLI